MKPDTTHVLVSFFKDEGQPVAILPVKRVRNCEISDLKEGVECEIEWTKKKIYPAKVLATGLWV